MALIKEYKDYLAKKMAEKFNLDLDFANVFIEQVEKIGKIEGFEERVINTERYGQLYDHYFGRRNKYDRIEVL